MRADAAPLLRLQMRSVVREIALMFPTAIISGRGREKVEAFVQLDELYYAGSHGRAAGLPSDAVTCLYRRL